MDSLLSHPDARQQGLPGQPLVGQLVAGRDVALVTPPDVPRPPSEVEPGQALVDGLDARPAGERDPEGISTRRPTGDPAGGELG
jgi:hypothetical protein